MASVCCVSLPLLFHPALREVSMALPVRDTSALIDDLKEQRKLNSDLREDLKEQRKFNAELRQMIASLQAKLDHLTEKLREAKSDDLEAKVTKEKKSQDAKPKVRNPTCRPSGTSHISF